MRVALTVGKQGFGINVFGRGQRDITGDCQKEARKELSTLSIG